MHGLQVQMNTMLPWIFVLMLVLDWKTIGDHEHEHEHEHDYEYPWQDSVHLNLQAEGFSFILTIC